MTDHKPNEVNVIERVRRRLKNMLPISSQDVSVLLSAIEDRDAVIEARTKDAGELRVEVGRLRAEIVGPMTEAGIYMLAAPHDPTGPNEVRRAIQKLATERDAARNVAEKYKADIDAARVILAKSGVV